MSTYVYVISGIAAYGQTWHTEGEVETDDFNFAIMGARSASFEQLTKGEARYGNPGMGCDGPYKITRFFLELLNPSV